MDKALEWGRQNNLVFAAAKTVAVLYHNKYKVTMPKKIRIGQQTVEYSASAKYLGITIDAKLNMNEHVKAKISKAKGALFKFRSAVGQLWGPKPALVRWIYIGIIRPMVSYGALVWAHKLTEAHRTALRRLQ